MANTQKKSLKNPRVTIVIGTLNRPSIVSALIAEIDTISSKIPLELIVIDQSNQVNFQKLQKLFPQKTYFKLVHFEEANTCKYLNYGWKHATAPIVLYLDDDISITEKTLSAHLKAYDDKKIHAVAGRVINDGEKVSSDNQVGKIRWYGAVITKNFSYENETYVDFPYGCNMSYRKSVLKEMEGFDERLSPPIYAYNEVDIGYRISHKYNNSFIFLPDALVHHHKSEGGGTRNNFSENEVFQSTQFNYGYFLGKNFNILENLACAARRLVYQIMKEPEALPSLLHGYISAKKYKKHTYLLPLIVFICIAYLRLWKVAEFFSFNFDEEYQASLAWEQVKNFHPIWIGVSASNVGYYLGPGFTYLNAILFKLSQGDPISLAWFSVLFGLITSLSVYYVAQNLWNRKVAIIAMTVYGGSALLNFFDRRFWNPTPIPFITLWIVYSLIKGRQNARWYILTAALVGASLNVHLSLVVLFPLIFFSILWNIKKIRLFTWVEMGISYLALTIPMLVFDFTHNFDNLRAPFLFIANRGGGESSISLSSILAHVAVFFQTLGRIWFVNLNTNIQNEQCLGAHCTISPAIPWLIFLSSAILLRFIYIAFKNRSVINIHIFSALALFIVSFIFYSGYSAEYYLLGFLILFSIVVGVVFSKMDNVILTIALSIFIFFNGYTILNSNQEQFGLITRKKLIHKIMDTLGDKPFSLEVYGKDPRKYHPYGGWRYLFKAYGTTPVQSFADEFFGWIYPDELSDTIPEYKVVITDSIEYELKNESIESFQEGAFNGYVFEEPKK